MIQIYTPKYRKKERNYVLDVIFNQWLSINWVQIDSPSDNIVIKVVGIESEIVMPDIFFREMDNSWMSPFENKISFFNWRCILDNQKLSKQIEYIPVIFGCNKNINVKKNNYYIPVDIIGTIFFMLSRYEEVVNHKRDCHGRFSAKESTSYKFGFLRRPIVDEYVEVLWGAINLISSQLKRKTPEQKILSTCDVDNLYEFIDNLPLLAKTIAGDLYKRGSIELAKKNSINYLRAKFDNYDSDRYIKGLRWIMDINERNNTKTTFYFIVDNSKTKLDGNTNINNKIAINIIKEIANRGHCIGLHPSYSTYKNKKQMKYEAVKLKNILSDNKIDSVNLISRQHYLRWDSLKTISICEYAGIEIDSTMSYADQAGFRCGTSKDFVMYGLKENRMMKLIQRPLILMESTIISQRYMDMGYSEDTYKLMMNLKKISLRYGGQFTFLWHNSHLLNKEDKYLYENLLK